MDTAPPARRFIRREVYRPETQDFIYRSAAHLFYQRGYHAASIREIAAEVGIQPATIYHHFGGKEALLYSIMERFMTDLLEEQSSWINGVDHPADQLVEMVRGHVLFHCRRPMEAFVTDNELRGLGGELRERVIQLRDQYQQLFTRVLERGMIEGVFHVPDLHVVSNIMLVMATGATIWYHPGGRLTLEEVADIHAMLALKVVLPAPRQDDRIDRAQHS